MEHQRIVRCKALVLLLSLVLASPIESNQQIVQEVLRARAYGLDKLQFLTPLTTFYKKRVDGRKHLKTTAEEFQTKILPDSFYASLPKCVKYKSVQTGKTEFSINPQKGTYCWGYKIFDGEKTYGPSFPAHTIEAFQGTKTRVEYLNHLYPFEDKEGRKLPGPLLQKFLTVDLSFMWANPLCYPTFLDCVDTAVPPCVPGPGTYLKYGNPGFYAGPQPIVTHLHGSETPSAFDGNPDAWFTPDSKITGITYVTNKYVYPNTQPAAGLWFHDHVLGETRLTIHAGLAGMYLLRGEPETSVPCGGLPKGKFEVELFIADRMFDTYGQPFFPDGNPCTPAATPNGPPGNPQLHPYAIPEFFGTFITVNGKAWPYLEVEPRRYRFRTLDGSNARMYALFLENVVAGGPVPDIWQIGSDGGLFEYPVQVTGNGGVVPFAWNPTGCPVSNTGNTDPDYGTMFFHPGQKRLFLAPAERADIIIDFTGFEGSTFILRNDSAAPFPGGGTILDPEVEGTVMQFRVTKPLSCPDKSYNPATCTQSLRQGPANQFVNFTNGKGELAPGTQVGLTRRLVLIEQEDPTSGGPVVVLVNNTHYDGRNPFNNKPIVNSMPIVGTMNMLWVTEIPQIGATEVWEIVNLTPDAHPMHIHLIEFQILNREIYNIGPLVPPYMPIPDCPCNPQAAPCPSYRVDKYEAAWCPANPSQPSPPFPPDCSQPNGGGTRYGDGPPRPYLSGPAGLVGGNPDPSSYFLPTTGLPAPWHKYPHIILPDPNERYWKDTIKCFPGTITRVVMRFSPQTYPVGAVTGGENKFAFDPTTTLGSCDSFGYPGGPGYVWHCHISDHEDNDMMRPWFLSYSYQKAPALAVDDQKKDQLKKAK